MVRAIRGLSHSRCRNSGLHSSPQPPLLPTPTCLQLCVAILTAPAAGVLVECDPSIKSIIIAIDSERNEYIIEDLDESHLVIQERMVPQLKKMLEEVRRSCPSLAVAPGTPHCEATSRLRNHGAAHTAHLHSVLLRQCLLWATTLTRIGMSEEIAYGPLKAQTPQLGWPSRSS